MVLGSLVSGGEILLILKICQVLFESENVGIAERKSMKTLQLPLLLFLKLGAQMALVVACVFVLR